MALSCAGDLITGLTLGSLTGTLERLPGLLILVPAAIGMRGNVFGALGCRISTLVPQGEFQLSRRVNSTVGQNVAATMVLSMSTSVVLAVLARAASVLTGVRHAISIGDFVAISVVGGVISSVVLLVVTLAVAVGGVGRGIDLDHVTAPVITTTGDVVTLPSLFAATLLVGKGWTTPVVAVACVIVTLAALAALIRRRDLTIGRRIVAESMPILTIAGLIDVVAGLVMHRRLSSFLASPALLVLLPPFLEESGALGSILAARLSTRLHLGLMSSRRRPWRSAAEDICLVITYAVPVYLLLGLVANVAAALTGLSGPGTVRLFAVSLLGGAMATATAVVVGFHGAVATHRLGLDPDSHGVPIVTASLDVLGVVCFLVAAALVGVS